MIRVEVEVCSACLGPAGGPGRAGRACGECMWSTCLLTVEGRGGWSPGDPGRTYGPPEDCYPPTGGEWDGDVTRVTRDDTGAVVAWDALPQATQDAACDLLTDAAEQAWREDDSDECDDEDRADARREDGF